MSAGRDHDSVNTFCCITIASYSFITNNLLGLCMAGGFALGTIWLSPDLDLEQSLPSKRLGWLRPLFAPYRAMCGHHRSIISHSPILSSLIRVAYCLLPVVCYLTFTQQLALLQTLTDPWFIAVLIGLELSTDVHLFLDWQYSLRKKLRQF